MPKIKAEAKFSLINRGRRPVHITSVESGCGCTTPSVGPTTIPPDGTAIVSAIATPLDSGERTVAITVHTDSPLSSEIILHFRMITDRHPPFITEVSGDFAYPEGYSADEVRELIVTAVESGPQERIPTVQTDLPFLSVSQPTVRERPFDESSLKQRTYTYRITFNAEPREGSFTGRIWAIDPGTGARSQEVLAFRRAQRSVVASPSTVTLNVGTGKELGRAELVVLTKHTMPRLVVEPASGGSAAIEISEITPRGGTRLRRFLIRAKPASVKCTEAISVLVKESPGARDCLVVPVKLGSVSP